MAPTGQPATRHVAAVQRATVILDTLGEARAELGTNEIARRTGINASTISRLLSTLVAAELVHYVHSTGRYRLGLRLVQLASAARENLDIRHLARPHIEDLAEITAETATLSIPGTNEALTMDFVQSPQSVRSVAEVGRYSVAHATAVGKVFLAYGGTMPVELPRYTERTITDAAELAAEADRTRERGWAQAVREREDDLNGVATPILDGVGTLVAILGVQGPAARFTRKAMREAVLPMRHRAGLISSAL